MSEKAHWGFAFLSVTLETCPSAGRTWQTMGVCDRYRFLGWGRNLGRGQ